MKLIEMVRKTREYGYRYCAVDEDGAVYSYEQKPEIISFSWDSIHGCKFIGRHDLWCNWQDTLIDVNKIKVK